MTVPPLKNAAYSFELSLPSQLGSIFQTNPTLASGDVQVGKDGGSFANIGSLPTAIDAGSTLTVALTMTEMNADRVVVRFHDAAGSEWCDVLAVIETVSTTSDGIAANVAAIKTKTDGLTFTIAAQVDVNVVDWKGAAAPAMTGDAFARLGAPVGASISADVAAVKAVLPSALAGGRMDASVGAYQTGLTPLQPATAGRTLVVDAAGLADANMVKLGPTGAGTAQTARDIGASVLLSSGTGAGQLDFTSGVVKANLAQILGTALTETSGQIAAGFKKFFNIATPAATMDHGVLVDTITTYTGNAVQTGDSFARLGSPVGASISADIAAVAGGVWTVGTRVLTAGTNIALAKGTGVTGFNDLDASGVRAAIGMASANLDTQIAGISSGGGLDAAGVRAAIGLASANLDTQLSAIDSNASAIASVTGSLVMTAGKLWVLDDSGNPLPHTGDITAVQTHGDSAWATATGFATPTNITAGTITTVTTVTGLDTTKIDASISSRLPTSGYTAPANSSIAAIKTVTDALPNGGALTSLATAAALSTTDGKVTALHNLSQTDVRGAVGLATPNLDTQLAAIATADENAAALLAAAFEGAETVQEFIILTRAALLGKADGLGGTTVHYRDIADTKDRITATVDADGNRTAVTTDAT